MSDISVNNLVLYKGQPAIVRAIKDKKINIEFPDKQEMSVRPKDVALLHPGPVTNFSVLQPVEGDIQTAWELLDSQPTSLPELSELAFGDYSPSTAWAAWQLVEEGVYFSGSPEAINTHTNARIEEILAARQARAAEETAWQSFVNHLDNQSLTKADHRYLEEVAKLALGQSETSRVLRQLGKPQTPETAHDLLLSAGYWLPSMNPYPARLGVSVTQPALPVGELPDEDRRDLTHLETWAIDDDGSTDPDDAISLDGDRLWVHVADAGSLVMPESPIDQEARDRAANLYLPEGTIHMLPNEITQRLGLGLAPVSPALSFALAASGTGEVELLEIVPSWVRVRRMSYEAAEHQLDNPPFTQLLALAEGYQQKRVAQGAVEIDLPETKVQVNSAGEVRVRLLPPLRSRLMVRELMLMVGELIGRLGITENIPLSYTVQDPPLPMDTPGEGMAGMFAQRKLMQRSRPQLTPGPHSGLGLTQYVQVTSPLRRYLDLVTHQQLRHHLAGFPPLDAAAITLRLGQTASMTGAIRTAERLSNLHWTLIYFQQNPQWIGDGVVVETNRGRATVLIPELAFESDLYNARTLTPNQTVQLAIDTVDLANRTARFKIVG